MPADEEPRPAPQDEEPRLAPQDEEPRLAPQDEGGDPACSLHRVCSACGRMADEDRPTRCAFCGARGDPP